MPSMLFSLKMIVSCRISRQASTFKKPLLLLAKCSLQPLAVRRFLYVCDQRHIDCSVVAVPNSTIFMLIKTLKNIKHAKMEAVDT